MILGLDAALFALAATAYVAGGFVKGAVGFALPLIAVTTTATLVGPETAVALVILPILVSNLSQAMSLGVRALVDSAVRHRALIGVTVVVIALSAPLLPSLDERWFFGLLGGATAVFAVLQLAGWRPRVAPERERVVGSGVGLVAGFFGGLSGIWGPPVVLYAQALGLAKDPQVQMLGATFLLGGLVLAPSHIATGVLTTETALLSAAMLVPTQIGMWLGSRARGRLDQERFRRWTLIVLILTSLNLLRRAALG